METVTSLDHAKGWLASDRGSVGSLRRCIRSVAIDERLSDDIRDRAVLVATELSTNLERHAEGGELFVTARGGGLDLLALDRGPGIADLNRALREGYSTAGGLGDGLGVLQRQADALEIQTSPAGTLMRARIGPQAEERPSDWAVVERAYPPGFDAGWQCPSGDAWKVMDEGPAATILMLDALGHGRRAASAARTALALGQKILDPEALLRTSAEAIGTGRGAVGAAVRIDRRERTVDASIVGNITVRIMGPTHPHRFASKDGILGPRLPTLRSEKVPLPPGHTLVLHTDGVSARRPVTVPENATPLMHAAYVYRAGARPTDDACVMTFRIPGSQP